jgi:hypothetical protein
MSKIIVYILASAILFAGCNPKPTPQPIPATKIDASYPQIPVYPDATVATSSADLNEGTTYRGIKYSEVWNSPATVPEVSRWYVNALPKAGWTLDIPLGNPNAQTLQMLSYFNDQYTLRITIAKAKPTDNTLVTAEFSTKFSDFEEPGEEEEE